MNETQFLELLTGLAKIVKPLHRNTVTVPDMDVEFKEIDIDSLDTLTPRDPAFFKKKYNVDIKIRHEVLSIDPASKTLAVRNLADGTEFADRYDQLILATGALAVLPRLSDDLTQICIVAQEFPDDLSFARRIGCRRDLDSLISADGH